jgi:amino acid adenylation domain-containing protein
MQQILERAARRTPDQPAFRFMDKSLSYSELDAASSKLASCLLEHGVKRGDRVAIYLNKSLECAVAIYGVLKAGAAYVPLDPGAPITRLCLIVEEGDIRWVISHDAKGRDALQLVNECEVEFAAIFGLSGDMPGSAESISWEAVAAREVEALDYTGRTSDDVAYIMYTSGSTGVPKGIVHSHHSGLSYALMAAELYELSPQDRLSNLPPLHFDQSIFDYFSAPAAGACTVIISEAYARLPASLSELMEREKLTVWYSVPFALIQLALHGVLESRDLSSLRCVLFGGEPFPPKHLARLMDAWPRARFCNVYGPAEVNQCTYHFLNQRPDEGETSIPIGMECPNVETLVVDEDDNPVPAGRQGELLVRTPTMMRGYFRRPDLNARAFYRRRNSDDTYDHFYRTGDLAVRNDSGELVFLGRRDRQVKLRGYRVELDEVEAAFDKHPEVEQSAAYVVREIDQHPNLNIAVCLHAGVSCSEKVLRSHAASLLPAYAVPDTIHLVEDFPRTSSGKIDRNSLCSFLEEQKTGELAGT